MNSNWLAAAALAVLVPLTSGCLPLAATGIAAGALMADDRRTAGTYIDDEVIENRALAAITQKYGDRAHVNVTSYNKAVLITGEAPDDAARHDIEQLVRATSGVKSAQNELAVGLPSSLGARSRDAFITSKVKARFVESGRFSANHVKVVTEGSTVYLMGLVRRAEADNATQIARTTTDVQKVVRVFEYLD